MSVWLAFLLALAVSLTLPSPTGQWLKCQSGQRRYTPKTGPDICKDCDPGTFMNLSEHSEPDCYKCSTCPAGHVGRPCDGTSDTVCCPYPDMTVMDMADDAYCVIPASHHKANHTTTDNNTQQVSDCGGTNNTSHSAALDKSSKDIVGLIGHILAIMLVLHSMFVLTLPQVPRCSKRLCIIIVAIITTVTFSLVVIFSLVENDVENMVFLMCVIFSSIYCVAFIYHTFPEYWNNIRKKTNVVVHEVPVSTQATSPEDDGDIPESRSRDPLLTGTNRDSCVVELSSQGDTSISPGGSSHNYDSDDDEPGVTVDWRSDSRHELAQDTGRVSQHQTSAQDTGRVSQHQTSAQASGRVSQHQTSPPTTTVDVPLSTQASGRVSQHQISTKAPDHVSGQQASPPTIDAENWHGVPKSPLSSETTNGHKFGTAEVNDDSSEVSLHAQTTVQMPEHCSCVGTESITPSASSVDIHTVKVTSSVDIHTVKVEGGGYMQELEDDANGIEHLTYVISWH